MTSDPTIVTVAAGESQTGTTREAMSALFKRRQVAYENLDAASLAADYGERATIENPTGVHIGPEAAERTLKTVFAGFLDITLTVEDLVIDGNQAVEVLSVEGTHIGEYLGMPPTGKRFKMPMVLFYEVANGRIVRERRIYDFTGMLIQIGVLRAKPA